MRHACRASAKWTHFGSTCCTATRSTPGGRWACTRADTPGVPVARPALLRDVWRLNHQPETNSLAVHVSRLRARLAVAGVADLVRTAPGGGYVLHETGGADARAVPLGAPRLPLDHLVRHNRAGETAVPAREEHAP